MRLIGLAVALGLIFFHAPLAVEAQQAAKVYRVGFLRNGPPPDTFVEGLRQGLRELGYVEGQNISIEYGLADSADQLPLAAAQLVRLNVDVILASGTPPVPVAKNATRTIPIVFVASIDPVATGVAASLARPGGNVTGFVGIHSELMGKRLELLREVVQKLSGWSLCSTQRIRATHNTSVSWSLPHARSESSCNSSRSATLATSIGCSARLAGPAPSFNLMT
jgi:ABC-type uncharacterized transport system substrate-binding protein